jgi:hypothetical protein
MQTSKLGGSMEEFVNRSRKAPMMRASLIWALVPNVILDSPPVEPGESDELKTETLSAKRKFWCCSTHIIFGFFIAYLKGN